MYIKTSLIYLKYTQFLFVKYTSIAVGEKYAPTTATIPNSKVEAIFWEIQEELSGLL